MNTILHEVKRIKNRGYKEIMLLGQNVNSYCDSSRDSSINYQPSDGFILPSSQKHNGILFPELLEVVASAVPEVRIRFMSPHPKVLVSSIFHIGLPYANC